MSTPSDIPQYRLLADAFFAPKKLLAGSIIATHASPGPHMQPINEAAEAKMEAWYNEEHPTIDKHGDPNYEKMYKPHAIHRNKTYEPGEVHDVVLLANPRNDQTGELSMTESIYARKDTDQRPGPAHVPGSDPIPEALAIAEQSGAAVVESAKETDPRKAGIKVS